MDKIAEAFINFTEKLQQAGLSGALDQAHLRVVEVDAIGALLNDQVPFQFDQDPTYNATSNAAGNLILQAVGQTGPDQTRHFYVYFDTVDNGNGKPPASVATQVSYQDSVIYEGQTSYRISAGDTTYYYHKLGAAIANMTDRAANDWVSYRKNPTAAREDLRGVPNLAITVGEDHASIWHPGNTNNTSTVLNSGPLKLTVKSALTSQTWDKTWEFYPQYATMTVLKSSGHEYWVLYEGTPGGSISAGDYYALNDGVRQDINTQMDGDIPGEEWVYFGNDALTQVLFVINHLEDEKPDSHWVMGDSMTVFGFGRMLTSSVDKYLDAVPGSYTIGFAEAGTHEEIEETIRSAYKPLAVSVGSGEAP